MNQYCRYCVNCSSDQGFFRCCQKISFLTESAVKRPNNCRHFLYCEGGDVITGKQYRAVEIEKHGQMQSSFLVGEWGNL